MRHSHILFVTAIALLGGSIAAHAGPCSQQIAQVEQEIREAQETVPPGGAGDPSAPQSIDAQLHHQPTPGSVRRAERLANVDGDAALARAQKADAAGDAAACAAALEETRRLYGVQ